MPNYVTTGKWGLRKLLGTSLAADIDAGIGALADDVDGKLAPSLQGTLAQRPPFGQTGQTYFATNDQRSGPAGTLYRDIGTAWVQITPNAVQLVTSLPASPFDGQVIDFLADADNGVIWRLRYRAASPSLYKWEWAGGDELYVPNGPGQAVLMQHQDFVWRNALESGSGADSGVTVPLGGDYVVHYGLWVDSMVPDVTFSAGIRAGATNPTDFFSLGAVGTSATPLDGQYTMAGSRRVLLLSLLAGVVLMPVMKTPILGHTFYVYDRWLSVRPHRVG
jgi:hypothetical protein